MTRPIIPPKDPIPDSTVSEIHALYREGAGAAEPGPSLDRAILDAARADLRADNGAKQRRQLPWWKRWIPATTAIAVAVIGLSFTLRVSELQESDLSAVTGAMEPKRDDAKIAADKVPGKAALSDHPTRSQAASKAEVPKPNQNDESKSGQNFSSAVREMTARPAPAAERRAIPARQGPSPGGAAQAPETMAQPVPASEPQKKSLRSDGYGRLEKSESDASGAAGAELARPPLRREAEHIGVSSRDGPAADSIAPSLSTRPDDATTPEAWLELIRKHRAAGRNAEAAQSLARFRMRYPDYVLPADLIQPE